MQHQRRLLLSTSRLFAHYHTGPRPTIIRTAFVGLKYKKAMPGSPKVGETRPRPDEEDIKEIHELPSSKKRRTDTDKKRKSRKKGRIPLPEPYSSEDVLWREVKALLGEGVVAEAIHDGTDIESPYEFLEEVELEIASLTPHGEGIARSAETKRPWAVVVPLALPGEKIRAKIYRNNRMHSLADLVEIITPNAELRDSSRVRCKYFGTCAGCQYQMLSYDQQLDFKRDVMVRAYKNFSDLPESSVPEIQATVGSPLQYGYRTKLTPHFNPMPRNLRYQRSEGSLESQPKPEWLNIGFNKIGTQKPMDIEDCPIATPIVNKGLSIKRAEVIKKIHTYDKGASLLLRDSLDTSIDIDPLTATVDPATTLASALEHICVTDYSASTREKVGDFVFEYNAGSFFQNNNSVLEPLTTYVRDAIFPPTSTELEASRPTHLIDAYCGAGLFAITLSPHFSTVAGIELSVDSIRFATRDARLNNIPTSKISFRSGDAADIFSVVRDFPREQTVLLIDPPRKGCDEKFLKQLLRHRYQKVVYVSCNVHTQARDVGDIVNATKGQGPGKEYVLESVGGFDLFPQTAHVEAVAVLRLL